MRISASLISKWATCPLQVKFDEIEQRPNVIHSKTTFGICIHDALELYNKTGDMKSSKDRFTYTWAHPELFNAIPEVWGRQTTFGSLKTKGLEILDQYHESNKWEKRDVIAAEHKFVVPFGDHDLSGIIDLLELKKSGNTKYLKIVDYKTTSRQPTLLNLRMNLQFTIYVYATLQPEFWMGWEGKSQGLPDGDLLYQEFANFDRRAFWFHLWANKEMPTGERDEDDFMRLYLCVNEIVKAVEKDVYVPNISGDSCGFCAYTDICKSVIPVRDKLLEITAQAKR